MPKGLGFRFRNMSRGPEAVVRLLGKAKDRFQKAGELFNQLHELLIHVFPVHLSVSRASRPPVIPPERVVPQ